MESVKAVEVGRREFTLTMAMRTARVLGIEDLAALYGSYLSYTVVTRPTHAAVSEVRRAPLTRRVDDGEPQTTGYVRAMLRSAWLGIGSPSVMSTAAFGPSSGVSMSTSPSARCGSGLS